MKFLLLLASAFALSATAAQAQTVLPSGAVAPAGAAVGATGVIVTPGTVPGSQPLATPDQTDGGSPRAKRRDEVAPGMTHKERKNLRKMAKPRSRPDGTMKPLPN
jgi:hypothetical protein